MATGLVLLAIFMALDWVEIAAPRSSVEAELLVWTPLGLLALLLVPFAFWLANRQAFATKSRPGTCRALLVFSETALWWVVAMPILVVVRIALGGAL